MKFNIVKKAFAVVLAAALVTTGMPVEMAGAGVVQAYTSPSDINLQTSGITTKAVVRNSSRDNKAEVVSGTLLTTKMISLSVSNGTEILATGTIDELSNYIDTGSVTRQLKRFDYSVGEHTDEVLEIVGQKFGGKGFSGVTEVNVVYEVVEPTATESTLLKWVDVDDDDTTVSSYSVNVGDTSFVTAKLTDSKGSNVEDAVISYSLTKGDEFVSLVNSKTGKIKAKKKTKGADEVVIKASVSVGSPYTAPTANLEINVKVEGIVNSPVSVDQTSVDLVMNGGSYTISPKNYQGVLSYRLYNTKPTFNPGDKVEDLPTVDKTNQYVSLSDSVVTPKMPSPANSPAYVLVWDDCSNTDYESNGVLVEFNVFAADAALTLAEYDAKLAVDSSYEIKYSAANTANIDAKSNNEDVAVATASNGYVKITGIGVGSTYVKVTVPKTSEIGASSALINVTVTGKDSKFALGEEPTSVVIGGESARLAFTGAADEEKVTAVPDEKSKDLVDIKSVPGAKGSGAGAFEITGLKVGEANITITDPGTVKISESVKTITLKVVGTTSNFTINPEKVESLVVNEKTTALYIGAAGTVTATPVSGTSGSVSALVNNGKIEITGLTAGDAAVAVKDSGSDTIAASEKTIAVTVVQRDSEFKLTETKADIKANGTANIGYTGNKGTVTTSIKSGDGVVKIDGTKVTGLKEGTAVITVTDPGNAEYKGASYDFTVNVTKNASSFALNATSASVKYGAKYTIGWKNAAGSVTVTSGNSAVATATNKGVVTIKKPGTVSFTVKDAGSDKVAASTKTFKLTIAKASQTVNVSFKSGSTKVGGTALYTISGIKTSAPTVTSGKKSVATIASKNKTQIKVKCVNAGTSKITVKVPGNTYYNAVTKTFNLKVTAAPQTLKVSPTSVTLASKGKTKKLTVTGNKTKVTYKSSNTKVAKVASNGKITAVKKGTCYVTVTAAKSSNYTAASKKIKVTVKK